MELLWCEILNEKNGIKAIATQKRQSMSVAQWKQEAIAFAKTLYSRLFLLAQKQYWLISAFAKNQISAFYSQTHLAVGDSLGASIIDLSGIIGCLTIL